MKSRYSTSRWLARWRLLAALLTTLGLLAELGEPSPLVGAILPSLVVIMMLVLVVHAQRLLDTLPVARQESEPSLGFASCDSHTGRNTSAGDAACQIEFMSAPQCPAHRHHPTKQ